jgi:hypothetical protein
MRRILRLALLALLGSPANADSVTAAVAEFGLFGSWATDCKDAGATHPGFFRMVITAPTDGPPTYTTLNNDDGVKTTVRSTIMEAVRLPPGRFKLTLRIFGGDRDGGPLPSATTNTFEQTFEFQPNGRLRMDDRAALSFQRCSN